MPADTAGRVSPRMPPRLIVSKPAEDAAARANFPIPPTLASRRRSQTESSAHRRSGRQHSAAAEWIDIDESSLQKRASRRPHRASVSSSSGSRSRRDTEDKVVGFFPKLGRILEGTSESRPTSRPGTSGSGSQRQSERNNTTRRHRHRDDAVGYRRPARHRVGGVSSRRPDSAFKFNPSLLSVLSTLTGTSDQSSSSAATITQASYDRKDSGSPKIAAARRSSETEPEANKSASRPSVFDYMEPASSVDDRHDGRSIYSNSSTASSHYEHSDAGSSDLSGSPSSQSTFASPTSTRNPSLSGSVAELRRKYDAQYASPTSYQPLARSNSHSPEIHIGARGVKKVARVRSVPEEEHDTNVEQRANSDARQDERQRSSSGSSRSSRPMHREEERLRHHEDAMRQHLAQSQQGQHHIDPTYGQRSHSASSHGSAGSARAYAQYMAMQQYQCPSPPPPAAYPVPPQAMNGHATGHNPDRPPVPDPPDFSQTTIAGYEQLALELSSTDSAVKPIYRKFEYLNHRILLHLQDELSEMEEQLRTLDEIVAQMEPCPPEGQPRPPASRRGDAFQGSEMHHRRTALLGRIFLKTEQYNRAMASYNSTGKDARAAEKEEIGVYREWLQRTGPVHEVETRFLMKEGDLVVPGSSTRDEEKTDGVAASPPQPVLSNCLPVGLMLPLVLFAFIPTLVGRLFVTSLIAVGAFLVASTTEIRDVMPSREWAVCAGVYVLVMAFIAGVMPQYGGS